MERLFNISGNWKTDIVKLLSMLFIFLFIYAASNQLLEIHIFHARLRQSPFIGSYAGWLVWMIPLLEILISVLFCFEKWKSPALRLSFLLMIIFSFYIIAVLSFSDTIPCSCSGVIASVTWKQHLIFNIGITFLASLGLVLSPRKISPKI